MAILFLGQFAYNSEMNTTITKKGLETVTEWLMVKY